MNGSVALLDFITYLVTKIILKKSNIGDPTRRVNDPIMNFFEDGHFLFDVKVYKKILQLFGFLYFL